MAKVIDADNPIFFTVDRDSKMTDAGKFTDLDDLLSFLHGEVELLGKKEHRSLFLHVLKNDNKVSITHHTS